MLTFSCVHGQTAIAYFETGVIVWQLNGEMKTFRNLSYGEKWRVARFLTRGKAPSDPRMALAAVELAESYQRQGRAYTALIRWLPAAMVVVFGFIAIPAAADGEAVMAVLYTMIILLGIGDVIFNPVVRPRNAARSLCASKQIVASEKRSADSTSSLAGP